jgi:hypothetical protein
VHNSKALGQAVIGLLACPSAASKPLFSLFFIFFLSYFLPALIGKEKT